MPMRRRTGSSGAWLAVELHFADIDFSGYSDMAIGLGLIMGFHYLELQLSLHSRVGHRLLAALALSLSTFFRDYVYIPRNRVCAALDI